MIKELIVGFVTIIAEKRHLHVCRDMNIGFQFSVYNLYQPRMIGDGDCGEIGGMKIGRGNRSTRRKPAPAPLHPPQIPTLLDPGLNPGPRGGNPANNRLSYGAASSRHFSQYSNEFRVFEWLASQHSLPAKTSYEYQWLHDK
jgi:hypothetical protein